MPRTKQVNVKVEKMDPAERNEAIQTLKTKLEATVQGKFDEIEKEKDNLLQDIEERFKLFTLTFPRQKMDLTLDELGQKDNEVVKTATGLASKVLSKSKIKPRRSLSCADDEDLGYLTTESDAPSTGSRASRSRTTTKSAKRFSRSLSRTTTTTKTRTRSNSAMRTPMHKLPPPTIGYVTPKIKPNAPQVVLRHPKQGEVAISLSGSPLMMVTGYANDQAANLNIPLQDGRLISIQPERGLRVSQLPIIDSDTKMQLMALRDNINEMLK